MKWCRPRGKCARSWRGLLDGLDALGHAELRRRWEEARELIRENGVTYNVYGDPRGTDRPWALDPLPLVISAEEGAAIEAGLSQRGPAARTDPGGRVRPTTAVARRIAPSRACVCPSRVFPALPRLSSSWRALPPFLRRQPQPGAGRTHLGHRRPNAGALGCRLRPGEPPGAVADAAGRLQGLPGAASGAVFSHLAGHPERAGPAQPGEPARRPAHPGAVQRNLF